MSDRHPSYPRPLVTQAICQIGIEAGPDSRAAEPLELLDRLRASYPLFEPVTQFTIQLPYPGSGVMPAGLFGSSLPAAAAPRYRLTDRERRAVLHVALHSLWVEVNQPYPGWDGFARRIAEGWALFVEKTSPLAVVYANIRYINRIPRNNEQSQISQLLRATDLLPAAAVSSRGKAYSRVEASDAPDEVTIVTFGIEQRPSDDQGLPPLIFDIERRWDGKMPPDQNAVMSLLDRLHESVWRVFAAAKTDLLDAYMQGAKQ